MSQLVIFLINLVNPMKYQGGEIRLVLNPNDFKIIIWESSIDLSKIELLTKFYYL